MIARLAYLVICLLMSLSASGQWRGLILTELGPSQGLTTRVYDMVQDDMGHVYLGGSQGLVRYDGSTFELFAHDPNDTTTIGAGEAYQLLVGSDSLIWIGTRYGGLSAFHPKQNTFSRYPVPELPYRMMPTAHGLCEDSEGNLWVGGHHFQLLHLDRNTGTYTAFKPDWIDPEQYGRRLSITHIIEDRTNPDLLWLSITDYLHPGSKLRYGYGVASFDKRTGVFNSFPNEGRNRLQDPDGYLYGTHMLNMITRLDARSGNSEELHFDDLISVNAVSRGIIPYNNGHLVTSTLSLMYLDSEDNFRLLYEVDRSTGDQIFDLDTDRNRNIWICGAQGVHVVDPDKQKIRFFSLDMFGATERIYPGRLAFDSRDSLIYLAHSATVSRGRIYRIPINADAEIQPDYLEVGFDVNGIATDASGQVWVAGGGTLHTLQENETLRRSSAPEYSEQSIHWLWNLQTSATGWIGGVDFDKFMWFKPNENRVRELLVDDLPVWQAPTHYRKDLMGFEFDRTGNYAYLLSSVLHRVELQTGKVELLKLDPKLNPQALELAHAVEDKDGFLWITNVQFTGRFKIAGDSLIMLDAYTVQNGLASTMVHEMVGDPSGRMWLFTDSGINCVQPETREVRYFGTNEGLPQVYIDPRQILTLDDGRIITVNNNGLIVFHPDSLWHSISATAVPVALKQVRMNGEPLVWDVDINYLQEITVPFGNHVVDIQFQGLEYPTAERLTYSYRLQKDNEWIGIGLNKLVTLPRLEPGNYTFQVKATLPAGTAPIRSLAIYVPTPIYRQAWFILLSALIFLSAVYLLYLSRVRRIKKAEAEKTEVNQKIAELELTALRSQMNPHFMFNSLNSIKDFILHAQPQKAAEYLSDFAHLIRTILQHSRQKRITLQEELETLMLYIELEQLRFDQRFQLHCMVGEDVAMDDVKIPPMLLQPYIENAIWHGLMHKKEPGNLTLQFVRNNGAIHCIIEDDGVGRDKAMELKSLSARRYKSMGMGITKDRIQIINSMESLGISVEIKDKMLDNGDPAGTRVTVTIPNDGFES